MRPLNRLLLPLCLAVMPLGALPLAAQEAPPALPFTYLMFEAAVPHVDMPVCPVDLAAEGRFCRMSLLNDEIHVFVFSEDGDQPLVDFRSWPMDLMAGLLD
ncbi:MAG: hypothetical protein PHX82_16520 [Paracoccaceae bacterium]|nr:hypothetical protein [Paracoccaceae bacterium]